MFVLLGFGDSESSDGLSKCSSPQTSPMRVAPAAPVVTSPERFAPAVTSAPEAERRRKLEREENEKLKRQIEAYKDIIEQQETFISVRPLRDDVTL